MKIGKGKIKLMVVTPYFPPHLGGVEVYTNNISKGFRKHFNWDVVVVTSKDKQDSKLPELSYINGVKVYRLPILFKISNTPINPFWIWQIKKIITIEKPDLINAHMPVPFMTDIVSLIKGNIPLVITYHALSLYKHGQILFNNLAAIYSLIGKYTLRKANSLIVVSKVVKNSLPQDLQDKTYVVNNSIWKDELIKEIKTNDFKRIVFIGSLEKTHSWKGLDQIIIAVKDYITLYDKNIELSVVGEGNGKESYIRQVKNLGIASHVKFEGGKVGKEKNNILRKSSILVSYPTTSNDAFPTVFLEAWAHGVPVISTNLSPINTIIAHKKNGYLVQPNDPKELAKAIRELFTNSSLRKTISMNAFKQLQKENLWDQNIEKIHKIFLGEIKYV